jgi:hypothetical protein
MLVYCRLSADDNYQEDSISETQSDTVIHVPSSDMQLNSIQPDSIVSALQLNKRKKFNVPKVQIMIGLDYSYLTPFVTEKDIYQGPIQTEEDAPSEWIDRNTKSNVAKSNRAGNLQFNLQANFWKGLFIGMNYQFFTIRNYKKEPGRGNLFSRTNSLFFLVAANFGYAFEFLKNKSLQLHPSIRIGGYTADGYYDSGKGRKFYFGSDIKLRYLIKRKFGLGIGIGYDFLYYKQKEFNDLFQREAFQKTTFSNIHFHAGFSYNITIRTKQ